MGMRVGYARVSTGDQSLDLQRDELTVAGCEKIFEETVSGARDDRPKLSECLGYLRPGDTLVVWKLDRLGRSLPHLIATVEGLAAKGIAFRSLREAIDTETSGGKLVFHLFAALAEFERDLTRERTAAGLRAARARGRRGGRPSVMPPEKIRQAQALRERPELSVSEICKTLGISPATFYRYTKDPLQP